MGARGDRFRDIFETLTRHGFGFALAYLGLERKIHLPPRLRQAQLPGDDAGATLPERLRLALEDLGAVYVKLGQILSTRSDILPPDYVAELAKLQDSSPAVPVEAIRAVIADELGEGAGPLLESLVDTPLATGSIGQAHLASVEGIEVVVKVRRPGVVAQVNNDLEILLELAKRAEQASKAAAGYHVASFVEEFSQTLRAELDYLQEAANAERFAANFAGDARVRIPRIIWDSSTSRVLTMERVNGVKISDAAALKAAGIDSRELAVRASNVLLKMIFEDGFFHADPHPGNFFVEPDGRLGVIDFGMVGHITETVKADLTRVLLAVVERDPRRLARAVVRMCGGDGAAGRPAALQADMARLLDRYADRPLAELPVVAVIAEVITLLRVNHLRLPREAALMVKMLVMADGLGKQLDPAFELTTVLAPYTRRIMLDSFSPAALSARLKKAGMEALRFGQDSPELVRRVIDVLEQGGLDIRIKAEELDQLMDKVDRTGNRIVAGMVAAALITAVGELVAAQPSRWQGWPKTLFAAGLGGVGALGGYLTWTSRRR